MRHLATSLNKPPELVLLLVALCFFSTSSVLTAQEEQWFYRTWTTEDGLPDNTITGIAQSTDGYLWVGTKGGLRKFNGAEFLEIPLQQIPHLPSRAVRAMHLDQNDTVWIALERGPILALGKSATQLFSHENSLPDSWTTAFADDDAGRIWLSYPSTLFQISEGKISQVNKLEGSAVQRSSMLARDSEGQAWLARGVEVGTLSEKGFQVLVTGKSPFTAIASATDGGLWLGQGAVLLRAGSNGTLEERARLDPKAEIMSLYEDRSGAVWLGTKSRGLFLLREGSIESIPTTPATVQQILEDAEGNIWVATLGGGLQLIRPRTVSLLDQRNGFPFLSAQSVSQSPTGDLWVVSAEGEVARRHRDPGASTADWERISSQEDWPGGQANCSYSDGDGRTWIGTDDEGVIQWSETGWKRLTKEDGLASDSIRSLLVDQKGDLWIATSNPNRLQVLRQDQIEELAHPMSLHPIRALCESPDGTIRIATSAGQLFRVEEKTLVEEKTALTEKVPFSIRTLHATSDGSVWIGYAGDGLGRLKDGIYSRLTVEEGLHDNYISQILSDEEGGLWFASNRGMSRVETSQLIDVAEGRSRQLRARIFGRSDGLTSLQPARDYSPTACRSLGGELYFSMKSGLLEVDVPSIRDNPRPPPVEIEKVKLDDRLIARPYKRSLLNLAPPLAIQNLDQKGLNLRLLPEHEKLEIHFTALSLTSPENVHFRYRLEPFDQNWIDAETRRSALYPRLPAGKYHFQVMACNNVGVWNETGTHLDFTVDPFFWETWWFRLGGGLLTASLAGGIVFLGLQRRHRQQILTLAAKRQIEQERSRIARDLHDDLGASLTRITLLSRSEPDDSEESEQVLGLIHTTAQDLIGSMEAVVWAVNPEHDTFDALANYLSNHAQSFLGLAGIRCRLDMPLELPQRSLSTQIRHNLFLAFKEALNNTVKHAQASQVQISLVPATTDFTLCLRDDGRGFDPASLDLTQSTGGNGLANMRSRMEEIHGSCIIESAPGEGTLIRFQAPFHLRNSLI